MDIKLTHDQEKAIIKTVKWFNDEKTLLWKIAGYAGTGKSTIINYITDDLHIKPWEIGYLTFTGKASLVIRRKANVPAKTIHSTIYRRKIFVNPDTKKREICWDLVPSIPYKLIVLDEVSMVDDNMMDDLMSFGIPICCLGDREQLPPISGKNSYFDNPDVLLTEIHRQALDNPLIYLSMLIREKSFNFRPQTMGDSVFITNKRLPIELQANSDIVLVGTHKMRKAVNNSVRKHLGFDNPYFNKGEKVICKMNNKNILIEYDDLDLPVLNGMIGYIENDFDESSLKHKIIKNELTKQFIEKKLSKIDFRPEFIDVGEEIYTGINTCLDTLGGDEEKPVFTKPSDMIMYMNRGYAITVHSSQGSEWNNVLIHNDLTWMENHSKWLYTAVTRAKEKLILKI